MSATKLSPLQMLHRVETKAIRDAAHYLRDEARTTLHADDDFAIGDEHALLACEAWLRAELKRRHRVKGTRS